MSTMYMLQSGSLGGGRGIRRHVRGVNCDAFLHDGLSEQCVPVHGE